MDSKIGQLDKKIQNKEVELSKLDESIEQLKMKRDEKNEELIKLKNERAAYQINEINLVLGEKGMKLGDILSAVKSGKLDSIINKK